MVADKVATEVDSKLHDYELVLVIGPEVTEEKFEATLDSVSRFVTGKGGVIAETERWGKRKLAYPIRHFVEGSYVLVRFQMEPSLGKELEANLRITEDVLRHLLVRLND